MWPGTGHPREKVAVWPQKGLSRKLERNEVVRDDKQNWEIASQIAIRRHQMFLRSWWHFCQWDNVSVLSGLSHLWQVVWLRSVFGLIPYANTMIRWKTIHVFLGQYPPFKWTTCLKEVIFISLVTSRLGLQEKEPQTDYTITCTWVSHLADMLIRNVTLKLTYQWILNICIY